MKITDKDLQVAVNRLNEATKSPVDTLAKRRKNGRYPYNVGHYMLDKAYGGNQLVRVYSEGGMVTVISAGGHITKSSLYDQIHGILAALREPSASALKKRYK